jgi:predicted nucleotidyltransferase component of viral defense system
MLDSLAAVEAFHLAFLRAFARSFSPKVYALKGGSNLRFFFGSIRYSEDMDLDVDGPPVFELKDKAQAILESTGLIGALRPLGIEAIRPPDLARAKQTDTVQRFKVHLVTTSGEDLATKVEFSRRGMGAPIAAEAVRAEVLRPYRMAPLIVPHYTAPAAAQQKLGALAGRKRPEARDVFDLYLLSAFVGDTEPTAGLSADTLEQARERIYEIDYDDYRDKVVAFLAPEERLHHDSVEMWDEMRLVVVSLIEGGLRGG